MPLLANPAEVVRAGLALLPPKLTSDLVAVQLINTGFQESGFTARTQMNGGPARGFWQCEQSGGVAGVLYGKSTRAMAIDLCVARAVSAEAKTVWLMLAEDDLFAAAWARLILWADPQALPQLLDFPGSWACYQRNWRPGAPRPDTWNAYRQQSLNAWGV